MNQLIYFVKRYRYIFISIIILIFISLIFVFNNKDTETKETVELFDSQVIEDEQLITKIKINIKGAVKNPGVYEINGDSRVEDAINTAGGLTENSDTSIINLSRKLSDEDVIIIYTKDEVKKIKQGNVIIQYIENECNCPEYENSACIDPDTLINTENEDQPIASGKISINKATIDELQTLSGIGESKAKAIIEYRNSNGSFKSIEEIKNVKGIGDAIFEKIKDDISI